MAEKEKEVEKDTKWPRKRKHVLLWILQRTAKIQVTSILSDSLNFSPALLQETSKSERIQKLLDTESASAWQTTANSILY